MSRPHSRKCFWPDCAVQVQPHLLCCSAHWYALSRELRQRVLAAYEPGQELRGDPSETYLDVLRDVREFALAHNHGLKVFHPPGGDLPGQGRLF
jgi:hypothetical protein